MTLVVLGSLGGFAAIGTAQTADVPTNKTVTLTNDTEPVTVSVGWNDSISDPANTSATVTFYNETEYATDPATATIALEDTIAADADNTTEREYNQSDGNLTLGSEYRVVVSGNASAIDSASISDSSGFLGGVPGVSGDSGGLLVGLAVVGLAVIGAAVWTMRD